VDLDQLYVRCGVPKHESACDEGPKDGWQSLYQRDVNLQRVSPTKHAAQTVSGSLLTSRKKVRRVGSLYQKFQASLLGRRIRAKKLLDVALEPALQCPELPTLREPLGRKVEL